MLTRDGEADLKVLRKAGDLARAISRKKEVKMRRYVLKEVYDLIDESQCHV